MHFAINKQRNETIKALRSREEDLRKLSTKRELICPYCLSEVFLRAGDINVPHFVHFQEEKNCVDWENESELHLSLKELVEGKLKEYYPEAEIKLEKHLIEINQVADIYMKHKNKEFAIEIQCSIIPSDDWKKRHYYYKQRGIIDIWLFAGDKYNNEKLNKLEKTVLDENSEVLYVSFEDNFMLFNSRTIIDTINKSLVEIISEHLSLHENKNMFTKEFNKDVTNLSKEKFIHLRNYLSGLKLIKNEISNFDYKEGFPLSNNVKEVTQDFFITLPYSNIVLNFLCQEREEALWYWVEEHYFNSTDVYSFELIDIAILNNLATLETYSKWSQILDFLMKNKKLICIDTENCNFFIVQSLNLNNYSFDLLPLKSFSEYIFKTYITKINETLYHKQMETELFIEDLHLKETDLKKREKNIELLEHDLKEKENELLNKEIMLNNKENEIVTNSFEGIKNLTTKLEEREQNIINSEDKIIKKEKQLRFDTSKYKDKVKDMQFRIEQFNKEFTLKLNVIDENVFILCSIICSIIEDNSQKNIKFINLDFLKNFANNFNDAFLRCLDENYNEIDEKFLLSQFTKHSEKFNPSDFSDFNDFHLNVISDLLKGKRNLRELLDLKPIKDYYMLWLYIQYNEKKH